MTIVLFHIWYNQFVSPHLVFLVLLDKKVKFEESFSPVRRLFLCAAGNQGETDEAVMHL